MPPDEIVAFVREHQLPMSVVEPLRALVVQLVSGSIAPTLREEGSVVLSDAEHAAPGAVAEPTIDDATPAMLGTVPARYDDLGRIGVGGQGEVRRVRDRELGRTCAFKVIKAELIGKPSVVARFVEESQVGAQLQHPNIAPVYDAGRLQDGRRWFTMKEVRGRTLTELVREVHAGELTDAAFRRLGDVFAKVCDGVGYAHARGVVHRDLKPDNVMVGAHSEVLVLDWGLAKVVGHPDRALADGELEPEVASARSADESQKTRAGGILGTAAYMSPEQARGHGDLLDARSDVYGLGAILYEVLAGRPPYEGRDARAVLRQVLAGPPEQPGLATRPAAGITFTLGVEEVEVERPNGALPAELVALCAWCMERDPADRPANGAAVAIEMRSWLDGSRRREKALEVVAAADGVVGQVADLREWAARLRADGDALLVGTKTWEPEETKAPGWAKLDEAAQVERAVSLLELKRQGLLQAALTHVPELAEAHAELAELEMARHRSAEAAREEGTAAGAELRMREHADALPEDHEVRGRVATYLRGEGALTLMTDVPGAEVEVYRFERWNRRLTALPFRRLGRTPIVEAPLPMGSYLCVVRHPERAEVRYPVSLGRGEHWDCVRPGSREPFPVRLPLQGELGPDECLVPAGWFWSGGDAQATDSLPRRRLWCDEFVAKRFPVTNREYMVFLDDLVASGREAEAMCHQPRERGERRLPVYGRDEAGKFVLRPDADGDQWDPDWPVVLVDWFGASAYAAWLADRDRRGWGLLGELEWEKAARGVDGRFYPWGDEHDPSWLCSRGSHPGRPFPVVVESYPVDTSPYGVRGLGGNVQDWCADAYVQGGPPLQGDLVVPSIRDDVARGVAVARVVRGGNWFMAAGKARSASRNRSEPSSPSWTIGFRLVFRTPPDQVQRRRPAPG